MAFDFFGALLKKSAAPKTVLQGGDGGKAVIGSILADKLIGGGAGHALSGGLGDDTYVLAKATDRAIEKAGAGIDTVQLIGLHDYVLADNLENIVAYGKTGATGNGLSNIITGAALEQTLEGAGGNDVLTGGSGGDTFVFRPGSGYDVITDFNSLAGDQIKLIDLGFHSFADVRGAMTQDGADTILQLSHDSAIRLTNVKAASLKASDFQLSLDLSKMHLSFEDNFDRFDIRDPVTSEGTWSLGADGPPNQDAVYVDPQSSLAKSLGINPFSLDGGELDITASQLDSKTGKALGGAYASGMMTTQGSFIQKYGYFEMRASLPEETGVWPAFWMLSASKTGAGAPELDIMEQIGDGWSHQAAHYLNNGEQVATGFRSYLGDPTAYHTYGMLWTAQTLSWYIDGAEVATMATPDAMDQAMYLIVNLAIGGDWAGEPGPNMPDEQMRIDYIRAYGFDPPSENDPVVLAGGKGPDVLLGDVGDDQLAGGAGADRLEGGLGDDILNGGAGLDTAVYDSAGQGVVVDLLLTGAQDTLGAGSDTLIGIENLVGSGFDDVLSGRAGRNQLEGGAGNDQLDGRAGADVLIGGLGHDLLTGGDGADRFVFTDVTDSAPGSGDLITDFQAIDTIDLSAIDANRNLAGNQAFLFVGEVKFSGLAGQLRLDWRADGLHLLGDVDGDRIADLDIGLGHTIYAPTAADLIL